MVRNMKEGWGSRLGVILAVAGSAVGLGNFLRFPGQAAQYGGGAFMVAYFISLLIIGLPICWAEWAMGRRAGQHGFNSSPGIFHYLVGRPWGKYVGVIGVIIPVVIYMYYVVIEAWCLGYAVNLLTGAAKFSTPSEAGEFFGGFVGLAGDGAALGFGMDKVAPYLMAVFVLNFVLIYRGLAKGIEWFCKFAMPTLFLLALIILVRVLTLGAPDPALPERNVSNGLGYMWNPNKTVLEIRDADGKWAAERMVPASQLAEAKARAEADPEHVRLVPFTLWAQLANPQLWLAAAGQIFFSLSVGFGVIITYASYLRRKDDVVLSGLAATSANEFAEVALGGLITLPAGVAFLGIAGVAGQGTFGLGFHVLPLVFSEMPGGQVFGFLFFFLLFLAAVTSSLSMLQPGIAFLEEAMEIGRRRSVAILGLVTALGCGFVVYFSADLKALDTLDFWVGTFLIFVLATIQIIVFGWILGVEKGLEEAHIGSAMRIPRIFAPIMKYLCPAFLIVIFSMWLLVNVFGVSFGGGGGGGLSSYVTDLFVTPNIVAWMGVLLILAFGSFVVLVASTARCYRRKTDMAQEVAS